MKVCEVRTFKLYYRDWEGKKTMGQECIVTNSLHGCKWHWYVTNLCEYSTIEVDPDESIYEIGKRRGGMVSDIFTRL